MPYVMMSVEMKSLNQNSYIKEISWKNNWAVKFSAGGYEAIIVPDVGGNVVELKNIDKKVSILRTPAEDLSLTDFRKRPQVYGLPVLFPPNRIEDGTFKLGEKIYKFPINEPKNNNYLHGFIKSEKWELTKKQIFDDKVVVEVEFAFTEKHKFYKYFNHKFLFKLSYELSKNGLKQVASVKNLSNEEMPVSVGYHTPFNVPFCEDGKVGDYRLKVSVDKYWPQDGRKLPTEESLELNDEQKKYVEDGIVPSCHPIESLYSLKNIKVNGKDFKGAFIEDVSKNLRVVYKMGDSYKYLVVWNDMGDKKYVCIEPQSSIINSPNVKMDKSISGFTTIKPGEKWSEECNIFVEDIK